MPSGCFQLSLEPCHQLALSRQEPALKPGWSFCLFLVRVGLDSTLRYISHPESYAFLLSWLKALCMQASRVKRIALIPNYPRGTAGLCNASPQQAGLKLYLGDLPVHARGCCGVLQRAVAIHSLMISQAWICKILSRDPRSSLGIEIHSVKSWVLWHCFQSMQISKLWVFLSGEVYQKLCGVKLIIIWLFSQGSQHCAVKFWLLQFLLGMNGFQDWMRSDFRTRTHQHRTPSLTMSFCTDDCSLTLFVHTLNNPAII